MINRKTLIICIDGCAPNYLEQGITPNLSAMSAKGFYKHIKSVLPSVTNVNHASIITGSFPVNHGITGNYYYDVETNTESFVDRPEFLQSKTLFEIYHSKGLTTALLAVKGKVLQVFGNKIDIGVNAEDPDQELLDGLQLQAPPAVSSADANYWLLNACLQVIIQKDPDMIYCTTNDYMMHNYSPDSEESINHVKMLDYWIGRLYEADPQREIYITADHGMNDKSRLINMQQKLDTAGYNTVCLPPMKDRYIENHLYQEGGSLFVYLKDPKQESAVASFLRTCPFVDRVFTRKEAEAMLRLNPGKIGDFVIFASENITFAEMKGEELVKNVRTHGSFYEQEIPLVAVNARRSEEEYKYNLDIGRHILNDMNR
jgi:phosphonoacetate hydrolase